MPGLICWWCLPQIILQSSNFIFNFSHQIRIWLLKKICLQLLFKIPCKYINSNLLSFNFCYFHMKFLHENCVTLYNLALFSNFLLMVLCSKFNSRMDCLHFSYKSPFLSWLLISRFCCNICKSTKCVLLKMHLPTTKLHTFQLHLSLIIIVINITITIVISIRLWKVSCEGCIYKQLSQFPLKKNVPAFI